MDNIYLDIFMAECYESETAGYLQLTQTYILEHMTEIRDLILRQFSNYLNALSNCNETKNISIHYLSMSFLYTSIYFETPEFQLDAYESQWIMGKSIFTETIDASWLFHGWKEYKERLNDYIRNKNYLRYIRGEMLQSILYKTVKSLIYQALMTVKYIMWDIGEDKAFRKLKKAERFQITFGEYLDWQKTVYMEQPHMELFEGKIDRSRTFYTYKNEYYRKKSLVGFDLSNSKFIGCHFKKCILKEVILNDCLFADCTFEQAEFINCIFYGTYFKNCRLSDVNGSRASFGAFADENNIYRNTELNDCRFENVYFQDSDLNEIIYRNCHGELSTRPRANILL